MAKEREDTGGREGKTFDAAIKEALRRGLKEQTGPEEGARRRVMKEEPGKRAIWDRQLRGLMGSVRRRDIFAFCQQLALLLECGMPLVKALNTLANRTENLTLARVIRDIGNRVEEGGTFTDAVRKHARYFPALVLNMFSAGEQSGNLVQTLYRVAAEGEKLTAARSKALVALIYPVMVLVTAVVVVTVFLGAAMSKFAELFDTLDAQVPATMRYLLAAGDRLSSVGFWVWVVLALVVVVVAYRLACRNVAFRLLRDRFLLRFPGIRHFVKQALVARFARVFSTMLKSGVPLQDTLQATRDTATNEVLRLTIERVQEQVRRGGRITPELEKGGTFPALAYDLSAIGEEAGALDRVYERMAEVYEEKLDTDVAMVSKLIQPLIVITLALIVGYILVAFMQTYAQLWQAARAGM